MDPLKEVEQLEVKIETWLTSARGNVADEVVAIEMQRVRAENSRGGIPLATPEALDQYEEKYRGDYDRQLQAQNFEIEATEKAIVAEIDAAIAASKTQKSNADRCVSTSDRMMARIGDELEHARLLRDVLEGRTLPDVDAQYEQAPDDAPVLVRMIESAFLEGRLDRFKLTAHPDDGVAVQRLQDAINKRREARVPQALKEARQRLSRVRNNLILTETRRHIQCGRGIARRPRPLTVGAF